MVFSIGNQSGHFDISSATDKDIIDRLHIQRDDYDEEEIIHRFWVDSYTGSGGFRNGQVPSPPAPFWGRAQYEYGSSWLSAYTAPGLVIGPARQTWSYLVPFRNEDQMSYNDRVNSSVYHNPIEPIVNVTHSFLMSEDAVRENLPPVLEAWLRDVDGNGHDMHTVSKEVLKKTQLVGRVFTLVDLPSYTGKNLAESKQLRIAPRLVNYWPQDILDYDLDADGCLTAIKIISHHEMTRQSMLDDKRIVERITIWTRDKWERWEIIKNPRTGEQMLNPDLTPEEHTGINYLGVVPVVICTWQNPVGDGRNTRGIPQLATISQMARALHNRQSEFDFNLRQSTFAQLVVPGDPGGDSDSNVIEAGPANALTEDADTKNLTRYIAPPGTIATTYQKELERLISTIYRTSHMDRGDSTHPETAESRQLRFMETNAIFAEVADNLDTWELDIYAIVAMAYRLDPKELATTICRRKRQYAVTDLEKTMNAAIKARSLPIGPVGIATMTKRIYRNAMPDLSPTEQQIIDQEIEIVAQLQGIEAAPQLVVADGVGRLITPKPPKPDPNADPNQAPATDVGALARDATKPIRVRVQNLLKPQDLTQDVPNRDSMTLQTSTDPIVLAEGLGGDPGVPSL